MTVGSGASGDQELEGNQGFARRLLAWFDLYGRKNLPWQENPTPYRVWISEVMLQQTQVLTVIPYYRRFLARFPDITALAAAPIDEVLHLWTGLGYYARARNLHACARSLVTQHGAEFPHELDAVTALPGIGRSTAGAILALSRGERHPILDGNAKRVLARVFGISGDPMSPAVLKTLWTRADGCTPRERTAAYTQAIMDLGATLCTRSRPACTVCPMSQHCIGAREGRQAELPGAKQRRARPSREAVLLIAASGAPHARAILIERRPSSGIWGGLWSPPQFANADAALDWCRRELGTDGVAEALPPIEHGFTHFDLRLNPLLVRCSAPSAGTALTDVAAALSTNVVANGLRAAHRDAAAVADADAASSTAAVAEEPVAAPRDPIEADQTATADRLWYALDAPPKVGLPQPIHKLFERLRAAG